MRDLSGHNGPLPPAIRWGRLQRLLAEAAAARADLRVDLAEGSGDADDAARRARAGGMLDVLLTRPVARHACRAALLTRISTRAHMASRNVARMETKIADVPLSGRRTRALAAALADLVHFADAGAAEGRTIDLLVVVESEEHRVVVGVAVLGGFELVAPVRANRALLRARSIVEAVGGDFQRGATAERMIFGIVMPLSDSESFVLPEGNR